MMPYFPVRLRRAGFTLSELLIALVILGLIATFTIPKVLQSQQESRFKAVGKEVASMLSGAYQAYQQQNTASAATSINNLTPFMNYVRVATNGLTLDDNPTQASCTCTAAIPCLVLHNGGVARYTNGETFNNTAATNALGFEVDPDGVYSGTTNGQGKMLSLFLYFNGRISTYGTISPNACSSGGCVSTNASRDPSWFAWN